jgi:hypothetical protein
LRRRRCVARGWRTARRACSAGFRGGFGCRFLILSFLFPCLQPQIQRRLFPHKLNQEVTPIHVEVVRILGIVLEVRIARHRRNAADSKWRRRNCRRRSKSARRPRRRRPGHGRRHIARIWQLDLHGPIENRQDWIVDPQFLHAESFRPLPGTQRQIDKTVFQLLENRVM